jgi:hypothetical protein
LTTETQHHPPIILHVMCWVALRLTQPTDYFTKVIPVTLGFL